MNKIWFDGPAVISYEASDGGLAYWGIFMRLRCCNPDADPVLTSCRREAGAADRGKAVAIPHWSPPAWSPATAKFGIAI